MKRTILMLAATVLAAGCAPKGEPEGADAVVGIDIDYEVLGENGGMLMVTASGTAVKLA
jgi:uncharacterized protein YbjQ (UPF0145 family)